MHNTFKVGDYWLNIAECEQRATCAICREANDSLEHILTDCSHGPQKQIWELTRKLWPHQDQPWKHPDLGSILGCGSIKTLKKLEDQNNTPSANTSATSKAIDGKARLLSILLAESAYLIWVIRCEVVIQGRESPKNIISKRWIELINKRIQTDRLMAKNKNYKKINASIVDNTWIKTLKDRQSLQPDW
ncbi:hypothetical protein BJ138DRAFT_1005912, partial [Hygrophoropsis aurantiaca]